MSDVIAKALDNPIIPAIGLALAATAGALWVAAAWWAYRDATHRAGSSFVGLLAAGWIVASSPLLLPLSLAVYTLARPQHTAAENRSRRLVAELYDQLKGADGPECSTCGAGLDPTWLRCPSCATWLAQPCSNCGGWSDLGLEICPWCGSEAREEPAVQVLQPAGSTGGARKTRRQQRRQPVGVMAKDARQPRRAEGVFDLRSPVRARG